MEWKEPAKRQRVDVAFFEKMKQRVFGNKECYENEKVSDRVLAWLLLRDRNKNRTMDAGCISKLCEKCKSSHE